MLKIPDVAVFISAGGYEGLHPFGSPTFYVVCREGASADGAAYSFGKKGGPGFLEEYSVAKAFSDKYGVEFEPFTWGTLDENREDILRTCLEKDIPLYHVVPASVLRQYDARWKRIYPNNNDDCKLEEVEGFVELPLDVLDIPPKAS